MQFRWVGFVFLVLGVFAFGGCRSGGMWITSPANGAEVIAGEPVSIEAVVNEPVDEVAFYRLDSEGHDVLLGRDTQAPYRASWTPTSNDAGIVLLKAVAARHVAFSAVTVVVDGPDPDPEPDPDPDPADGPGLIGLMPGIGSASDVVVRGDTAFIASRAVGLSTVDFSNPNAPRPISAATSTFAGEHVAVSGDRAVVAGITEAGFWHVWVLDLAAPGGQPTVVGELSTEIAPGSSQGFFGLILNTQGDRAILAAGSDGVWALDLSDPTQPTVADTYHQAEWNAWALGIAFDEVSSRVYVAYGGLGMHILNLTPEGQLTFAGSVSPSGVQRVIAVDGERAYMANSNGLFRVFDVSNPAAPRWLGSAGVTGIAMDIAIEDTRAATIAFYGQDVMVDVFDLTDDARPLRTGTANVERLGASHGVDLHDGFAYAATGDEGVKVYDATLASLPMVAHGIDRFRGEHIASEGDIAVIAGERLDTGFAHIQVVDLSSPESPTLVGELSTTIEPSSVEGFFDVVLSPERNLAVLAVGYDGLWIVDLSDPASPQVVGTHDTDGWAFGVDLEPTGMRAYVAEGTHGLKAVDLTNAHAPVQIGALPLASSQRAVTVEGNYAYVASQGGPLRVVDVSDPTNMRWMGSIALSGFGLDVASRGTLVVAASSGEDGRYLDVIDAADPQRPTRVASLPVAHAAGVAIEGDTVVIAAGEDGAVVADVSNPGDPQRLYTAEGSGQVFGAALDGNTVRTTGLPATLSVVGLE